ncbi:hypothetical protein LOTGIDRAFT_133178, partial [Lottia gigantea]
TDINECDEKTFNCSDSTTCSNTLGSYQCQCQNGYEKKDGLCVDFDECATKSDDCEQSCENFDGTYNCGCEYGFELAGDRKSCLKDINECNDVNACEFICENKLGSFSCSCPIGKELENDGRRCSGNSPEDGSLETSYTKCIDIRILSEYYQTTLIKMKI